MVEAFGVGLGVAFTLVVVVLHFSKGTGRTVPEDISQQVLDRRAETVPETDFPEPMNRSIGGGAPAGAIAGGEAGSELEEGEAEAEEDESPSAIPDDEAETYEITYEKEGETIDVPENQTLLEAGEDQGWDLPYACRQGQCISCGGYVADGGSSEDYLIHDGNEMLGDEELSEGYTLTCVAYPTSDLTLQTGESP